MKRWFQRVANEVRTTLSSLPPTLTELRSVVQGLAHLTAPGGPLEDLMRATAALAWAKAATMRPAPEPPRVQPPRRADRRSRWRRGIFGRWTGHR